MALGDKIYFFLAHFLKTSTVAAYDKPLTLPHERAIVRIRNNLSKVTGMKPLSQ